MLTGYSVTYINIMDMIKKQNENYLLQQFRQSDYNISNIMNETDKLLKLLVLDDNIQKFLQTNSFTQDYESNQILKAILNRISDYISNYSYINSIYFFTEDGRNLGKNSKNSIVVREKEDGIDFISSDVYNNINEVYPKLIWYGGYKEKYYNPNMSSGEGFIISAAKRVKPLVPGKGATLVFNIKERYLASIYSVSNSESNVKYMYIIDENGQVVSSVDGKNVGGLNPVISNIKSNSSLQMDYGSFTSEKGKDSIQTVYYRLKGTGWYLVGEIPLNYFSGEVLVIQRTLLLVLLASIFIIFVVSFLWLKRIMQPLHVLAGKMHDVSGGKLGLTFSKIPRNELGIVITRFNEMSLSIVELLKKNEEIEEEKRVIEIEALQSQINPHFIYNTLNMIKWMAVMSKSKNIVDCIVSFGNILRPAFKSTDKMCLLKDEIEYIDNYMKIMNWRFGNKINLEFRILEDLYECKVPKFILQPIVENSVTHGMKRPENSIDISIEVINESNGLLIIVSDTGTGIIESKLNELNHYLSEMSQVGHSSNENGSIGLYNVNRRIRLNLGKQYGIHLESLEEKGTKVFIKLPIIR